MSTTAAQTCFAICSRNKSPASKAVKTTSNDKSSDAAAAARDASPQKSRAGAATPPLTIAPINAKTFLCEEDAPGFSPLSAARSLGGSLMIAR